MLRRSPPQTFWAKRGRVFKETPVEKIVGVGSVHNSVRLLATLIPKPLIPVSGTLTYSYCI